MRQLRISRPATAALCALGMISFGPIAVWAAVRDVEAGPIACWWRTSTPAVMVGERFTVTLTCEQQETERDSVVVDPNQLDPAALALAPFEVVSGRRHPDVVAAAARHFQYEYLVRILGNASFGQDVDLPALSIKYSRRSNLGGGNQERELTYQLPPLPMRVLSLLPAKASDIREPAYEAFRARDGHERRARTALTVSAIAFAFAAVLFGLALVSWARGWRARRPRVERVASPGAIVAAAVGELQRLTKEVARDGWTPERAARTLAALRVASAVALDRPVAQERTSAPGPAREGQIVARSGLLGSQRVIVSAATGAPALERRLTEPMVAGPVARSTAAPLAALHAALGTLTSARYSPAAPLDTTALDAALHSGLAAARRLRWLSMWPFVRRGPTSPSSAGAPAWTR